MSLRHQRRRRLLSEESLSIDDEGPVRLALDEGAETLARPKLDVAAASSTQSEVLVSLVPTGYLSIALVLVAGLSLVGLILFGHHARATLSAALGNAEAASFDLAAPLNFGQWFGSSLWLAAGMTALYVYALRRHSADDYHGRYRVWIMLAGACLVGSLIETAGASAVFRAGVRRLAALGSLGDSVLWPACVAIVLALVGLRLFVEIRKCRSAVAALAMATCALALATAARHGWLGEAVAGIEPLGSRGGDLVGYVLVLSSFLLFARHTLAEVVNPTAANSSDGRPTKRRSAERPPAGRQSADASPRPTSPVRTDLDPVDRSAESVSTLRMPSGGGASRSASGNAEPEEAHGLSRAERRRQRREARLAS